MGIMMIVHHAPFDRVSSQFAAHLRSPSRGQDVAYRPLGLCAGTALCKRHHPCAVVAFPDGGCACIRGGGTQFVPKWH